MKYYLKYLFVFLLSVGLTISPVLQVVSYADMNDLLINTDSNALMTLDLSDEDYAVMPMSSIGSVINTVRPGGITPVARYYDSSGISRSVELDFTFENNVYSVKHVLPSGSKLYCIDIYLGNVSLPSSGSYAFSFDLSSQFYMTYDNFRLYFYKSIENASSESSSLYPSFEQNAGDLFVSPFDFNLSNVDNMELLVYLDNPTSQNINNLDFSFSIGFKRLSYNADYPSSGVDTSSSDYQSDVSSSLSDLSSSVESVEEEISLVTQAIQTLQGAMEPHYDNVLTQLHHITEQLHAFYDQIYNNIHLKEYALWQDIKTAIENIDLEVNVNLDKLKTSIDNMSTAIQNKLQSVQEAITNGFDNQGINQDAAELDQSLQEYEEAEQTVLDQVNDSLDDFEFDAGFDEYKTTISVFSDFLQDLYESSGGFQVVINLSLMLSIAGIVIGVYRFKDGG